MNVKTQVIFSRMAIAVTPLSGTCLDDAMFVEITRNTSWSGHIKWMT